MLFSVRNFCYLTPEKVSLHYILYAEGKRRAPGLYLCTRNVEDDVSVIDARHSKELAGCQLRACGLC